MSKDQGKFDISNFLPFNTFGRCFYLMRMPSIISVHALPGNHARVHNVLASTA